MLWHWSRGYATCIVFFAASLTGAGSKPNLESLELLNEIDALEQRLADAKATYEHLNDEAYDDRRLHDVSENDEGHEFFENKTYSEGVCNNTEWCATKKDAEEIHEIGSEMTFALSIVLFVEASIALLFITKWKDSEVRKSVFRMLSTTVSIFCAVMINHLVSAAFLYQFLPCQFDLQNMHFGLNLTKDLEFEKSRQFPCRRASEIVTTYFNLTLFFLYHAFFQAFAAYFRPQDWNNKRMAFAVSNLGAHLEGFAAVAAFGEIQHKWYGLQAWPMGAVTFVMQVWLGFIFLKIFSYFTREHCRTWKHQVVQKVADRISSAQAADGELNHENTDDSRQQLIMPDTLDKYYTLPETRVEDANEWRHCIEEREDDSAGVCIGFLIMQLVQLWVFGSFGKVEEETGRTFNEGERNEFFYWGTCLLLVALIGVVVIRVAIKYCTRHLKDTCWPRRTLVRASGGLHTVVGMSFGWAFFKTGDWFWRTVFNDLLNPEVYGEARRRPTESIILMARMTNACCLSALCIAFVILHEFLREAFRHGRLSYEDCRFSCAKLLWSCNPFGRVCCLKDCGGHEKDIILAFGEARVSEDKKRFKAHEEALHEMVATAGFVVGICWEKAITQANEMLNKSVFKLATAVQGREQFEGKHHTLGPLVDFIVNHPIFWKCYIVFIVVFILVIWYKYLVPYVCIPVHEHIYLQSAEEFVTEGQVDPSVRLVHEALYKIRHAAIESTRARCPECLSGDACCGHESGLRNDGCPKCQKADEEIQEIINKQMEQFGEIFVKQEAERKESKPENNSSFWCFSRSACRDAQAYATET